MQGNSERPESRYEDLARRARLSGDYSRVPEPARPADEQGAAPDREARERLREEMEFIVRAESAPARTLPPRGGARMRLAKFVKFREEKFGGVIFETKGEKVYTLNPAGAAVLRELSSGADGDVVERLKERFNDPDGRLAAEAAEFLAELRDKGLIEG